MTGTRSPKRIRPLKVKRICQRCGSEFGVISNGSPARFCSLSCSSRANADKVAAKLAEKFIHHDEHRQMRFCHQVVNNLVAGGYLDRPTQCERCGKSPKRIEGAHIDYNEPLLIAWICKSCHTLSHFHPHIDAEVRKLARFRERRMVRGGPLMPVIPTSLPQEHP